jgi:hypothetical protein
MPLTEAQKLRKAEQDSKRYYENKLIKETQKALDKELKIQKEQERKDAIKKERIYRFKHMDLKRPKYGPNIKPNDSNIILNDLIHDDSDSEIDPVPYEQPSRLKYKFV